MFPGNRNPLQRAQGQEASPGHHQLCLSNVHLALGGLGSPGRLDSSSLYPALGPTKEKRFPLFPHSQDMSQDGVTWSSLPHCHVPHLHVDEIGRGGPREAVGAAIRRGKDAGWAHATDLHCQAPALRHLAEDTGLLKVGLACENGAPHVLSEDTNANIHNALGKLLQK